MKKYTLIIILILVFVITGCDNGNVNTNGINTQKEVHEHCTRSATAGENIEVNLSYEIYYKGDVLKKLESIEQVITNNQETLTIYEDAYKAIHNNYNELKHYEANVERKKDSVTSKIVINYEKIDIDKLIDIEGEDDNIFENKIPKASKWKELAKKIGTKCEVVTK